MWTTRTIALAAGIAVVLTGGSVHAVTTVSHARGYASCTASMTEWPWYNYSFFESFDFISNPGSGFIQDVSSLPGRAGSSSCSLVWQVDYPFATPSEWRNLITAKGHARHDENASASSAVAFHFTVDRDGIFDFSTSGDGRVMLTGTLTLTVSDGQSLRGFLPAGSYQVIGDATQGEFSLFIPSPSGAVIGIVLAAARRRRIA